MANQSVLVIGAGVIGLSTACLLKEAGYEVTVYTKDLTKDTTSAVAGAFWEPYLAKPIEKGLRWSKSSYDYMVTNMLGDPSSGVRETVAETYFDHEVPDPWWSPVAKNFRRLTKNQMKNSYVSGWSHDSLVIDTPVHLPWLLSRTDKKGIKIQKREVKNFDQVLPDFDVIVNCSGLGAAKLCNDSQVFPIRGQVVRLAPNGFNKVIIDENDNNFIYVVPRSKDIVIGGTSQANNWNLEPDPKDTQRIMTKLKKVLPEFSDAKILGENVGLRPGRSEVRLEVEALGNKPIIHNYGHGGSGYTLSWGCAKDVVALLDDLQD